MTDELYIFFGQKSQDICQTSKFSAGQNENLVVLSDSPAVFAKTAIQHFTKKVKLNKYILNRFSFDFMEKTKQKQIKAVDQGVPLRLV